MSSDLHLGAISQEMASGSPDRETLKILIKEFGHRQRHRVLGPDDPCPTCNPPRETVWVTGEGWR